MDVQYIKDIIDAVADTGLAELHLTVPGLELRIVRANSPGDLVTPEPTEASYPRAVSVLRSANSASAPPEAQARAREVDTSPGLPDGRVVRSPMVGTFYRASARDGEPLAKVDAVVAVGAPVCIIESMKIYNEIDSDYAGTVTAVLCEDGQAVTMGQALMVIK